MHADFFLTCLLSLSLSLSFFVFPFVLFDANKSKTCNAEGFENLRPLSYPESDVFLIVFDVTNPDSLSNVKTKWVTEIRETVPNPHIVLVGNKCDLQANVDEEEMHRVARTIGAAGGMALICSALNDEGVDELFNYAIRSVLSASSGSGDGGCCTLA